MYPELVRIGNFPVTTYGIFLALGMLLALMVASRLGARDGLPKDRIYDLGLWTLVGGLVGSKILMYFVEPDVQLLSLDFLGGPFGDLNLAGPAVRLPGGAVHDFIPHLAYLFLSLTGATDADRLTGVLTNRSGNTRAGFDFLDALVEAGETRGRLRIATDTAPDAFRVIVRGSAATADRSSIMPTDRKKRPSRIERNGSTSLSSSCR